MHLRGIEMKGPIERFKSHLGLIKKRVHHGTKKRDRAVGSTYRDYRGIDGVVEDAVRGKKKK